MRQDLEIINAFEKSLGSEKVADLSLAVTQTGLDLIVESDVLEGIPVIDILAKLGGSIKGVREIFELTKRLGGTISGEHGIGFVQKDYMDIVFSEESIILQKNIKRLFDPNNILNPSKIFI